MLWARISGKAQNAATDHEHQVQNADMKIQCGLGPKIAATAAIALGMIPQFTHINF